jgi:ADP-ribose pyrophosphatase
MDAMPPTGPSAWQNLSSAPILQTPIFTVRSTRFKHPARSDERNFVVIDPPDWVNVIALTADDHIVLVRQFRYGIDDFSLEIPGGVMESGEAPAAAGLRELQEETGYTGTAPRVLGQVRPNPAIQSNQCHFIFIENAVCTSPMSWDDDEEIEVTTLPVEQVLSMARSGLITHSLVLNALFLFEPYWRERHRSR